MINQYVADKKAEAAAGDQRDQALPGE